MTNIITNYICETNFIIGIFIGLILCPLLIYIIGKFCDVPQITYKDGEYDVRPKNY